MKPLPPRSQLKPDWPGNDYVYDDNDEVDDYDDDGIAINDAGTEWPGNVIHDVVDGDVDDDDDDDDDIPIDAAAATLLD